MGIRQGDLYWIERPGVIGSEQAGVRPHVVVQNDSVNDSAIRTVLVCPLTTNLRRAAARGNVLLKEGEGGLRRDSVVVVAQATSFDRSRLTDRIGALSRERLIEIVRGINLIIEPREKDQS